MTSLPISAGAFAEAVFQLYDAGLCPMPCGADTKGPLIQWGRWKRRPPRKAFADMLNRPSLVGANIGILTGFSGVSVIDCDDPGLIGRALALFGDTPLVTRTPSGGHHAWYRSAGEPCANLRPQGLAIDLKGRGGFVITPPSRRNSGDHAGRAYEFVTGGFEHLPLLPEMRASAREKFSIRPSAPDESLSISRGKIQEGARNRTLFKAALFSARNASSLPDLVRQLADINRTAFAPPLSEAEVAGVAASAWGYQAEGRNFVGGGAFMIAHDHLDRMRDPDALRLLAHLIRNHAARELPFAIAPEAMAEHRSIPGMSARGIRRARQWLMEQGYLELVHQGGRGPGDPSLFRLGVDPATSLPK